jgi:hypothetical protein
MLRYNTGMESSNTHIPPHDHPTIQAEPLTTVPVLARRMRVSQTLVRDVIDPMDWSAMGIMGVDDTILIPIRIKAFLCQRIAAFKARFRPVAQAIEQASRLLRSIHCHRDGLQIASDDARHWHMDQLETATLLRDAAIETIRLLVADDPSLRRETERRWHRSIALVERTLNRTQTHERLFND